MRNPLSRPWKGGFQHFDAPPYPVTSFQPHTLFKLKTYYSLKILPLQP